MAINSARGDWDQLCQQYYLSLSRFNPSPLVQQAWNHKKSLFNTLNDDEYHAEKILREMMLSSIEEFPITELDNKRNFQRVFIAKQTEYYLSVMAGSAYRKSDPLIYLPYSQLIQLMTYPVESFSEVLNYSLAMIPERLRIAKSHLSDSNYIVDIYLLAAINVINKNETWLLNIPNMPVVKKHVGTPSLLITSIELAISALNDYKHFLENDCQCHVNKIMTSDVYKRALAIFNVTNDVANVNLPSDKIMSNNFIGNTAVTRFKDVSILSLQPSFFVFKLHYKIEESEQFITPVSYMCHLIIKDNDALVVFDELQTELNARLPMLDEENLVWRSQKLFILAILYAENNQLIQNVDNLKHLLLVIKLLAYIDYSLHWQQKEFSQVMLDIRPVLNESVVNPENLFILALRTPGFYLVSQIQIESLRDKSFEMQVEEMLKK